VFRNILLALILYSLNSCDPFFWNPNKFKNDFIKHISNSDLVLFDGDFLHPTYAYLKNGKLIGIEFNAKPECGSYIRRYYLNENEKIEKIVIRKDFWSEYCETQFDSIYVIELPKKQVKVYTKSTDAKLVSNKNLIEKNFLDVTQFKHKTKDWKKTNFSEVK
jgi:hypothetical protein